MKDLVAGAICLLIGSFFALQSVSALAIGSAARMGPGYFPLVVSALLIALGGVVLCQAAFRPAAAAIRVAPVRSLVCIAAAPAIFGMTVRPLGLIPAVALTSLASTFAMPDVALRTKVQIAIGLTFASAVIFSAALGLNLPLFGQWLPWLQ
jgi:hypothetical protein